MWKIRSLTELDRHGRPKYWSDEFGWTWKEWSDVYTTEQKDQMMLPKGGVWEEQHS